MLVFSADLPSLNHVACPQCLFFFLFFKSWNEYTKEYSYINDI